MKKSPRLYYSLKPKKAAYSQPNTVYLSVTSSTGGDFICAHGMDHDQLYELPDPDRVAGFISALPSATWIVCYDLWHLSSIIGGLIPVFNKISGLGTDPATLTLELNDTYRYCIDMRQFFLKSLYKTCTALQIPISKFPEDNDTFEAWNNYNIQRVKAIQLLWYKLRQALQNTYDIHPSKTPGATALKTWRPTTNYEIKARGRTLNKLLSYSQKAAALHWKVGNYPRAYLYDINSAYPFVQSIMSYPLTMSTFAGKPPTGERWIAIVKVNYQSDLPFAPFSTKLIDNETVHPVKVENNRIALTYIDAITLAQTGQFEILEFVEGVAWDREDESQLFRDWALKLETASRDPQTKLLLKVVSRALHSKFTQRGGSEIYEILTIDADQIDKYGSKILDIYQLDNELAIKITYRTKPKFKPFIRPDWEALTMALCRQILYSVIDENTIYADTDSIISTVPRPDLSLDKSAFGSWKLENSGSCIIAGPRSYLIGDRVKSAGIYTRNYHELIKALKGTVTGITSILEAIENPSIFSDQRGFTTRDHTIRPIPYPHVTIKGNRAFVTRSPTIETEVMQIRRVLWSSML